MDGARQRVDGAHASACPKGDMSRVPSGRIRSQGSLLPIPVAHGEGKADFSQTGDFEQYLTGDLISLRYIDAKGEPTVQYPANPNGSPAGTTGFTSTDGRATIMMPHPEGLFRAVQMSYKPTDQFTGEAGPWLKMFQNARAYVS